MGPLLALALSVFVQPNGPAVPIFVGATVTTSGSLQIIGLISAEVDLVYSVSGTVTGGGYLTFTATSSDPQNPTTAVSGDVFGSSSPISATSSSGVVVLSPLRSSAVNVSWTVSGAGLSFGGVDVTVTIKSAITNPIRPTTNFYYIPESGTVVTHVNATDLHNGTARVGPAWTQNGTVPYSAGPPAAVGPFTTSTNWFSQTGSPLDSLVSGPWTVAIIFSQPSLSASLFIESGAVATNGWYVQSTAGNVVTFVNGQSGTAYGATANTITNGALNIVLFGLDASGTSWVQLNNGSPVTLGSQTVTAGASGSGIGSATVGTFAFNGTVYEVLGSTNIPSAANFTALYNAIVGNGG
jgi:hypothetical protein